MLICQTSNIFLRNVLKKVSNLVSEFEQLATTLGTPSVDCQTRITTVKKILLIEQDGPAHVIKFFCNGLRIFRSTQFMQTCLICSCKCYWTPIEMRLFRLSLGRTRSSVGLRKKITSRNYRLNDATTCDYVRSPKFLVVIDQQSETRVPLPDDQE